jgi:enoyl-[acyl-carrier protein] reductase II
LAGEVSANGGLGVIASGGMSPEELRVEIKKIREMTSCPYAVNIALKSGHLEEIIQVVKQEHVPVIITGAGNPEAYMKELKDEEAIVIPVVASVALARRIVRYGADAVIAEGSESGGHIGNTNTMCLIPQVVDAVDVPVIAAGGIADGRGVAASYMLGASGVQIGTRFLTTKECPIHDSYKQLVLRAKDISTVVLNTTQVDKDNIRALKSMLANRYIESEKNKDESIEGMLKDALRKAVEDGDLEKGIFMAGQSAGLIQKESTVAEVLNDVWKEACECMMSVGDLT